MQGIVRDFPTDRDVLRDISVDARMTPKCSSDGQRRSSGPSAGGLTGPCPKSCTTCRRRASTASWKRQRSMSSWKVNSVFHAHGGPQWQWERAGVAGERLAEL